METKYSPKKAAMVLLDSWIALGGHSPHWMDTDEMEERLHDFGWKVTDKRREDIIVQVDKVLDPLQQRITNYIEKM